MTWSHLHTDEAFGGSDLTFGPGCVFIPQLVGLLMGQRKFF